MSKYKTKKNPYAPVIRYSKPRVLFLDDESRIRQNPDEKAPHYDWCNNSKHNIEDSLFGAHVRMHTRITFVFHQEAKDIHGEDHCSGYDSVKYMISKHANSILKD